MSIRQPRRWSPAVAKKQQQQIFRFVAAVKSLTSTADSTKHVVQEFNEAVHQMRQNSGVEQEAPWTSRAEKEDEKGA